MQREKHGPAYYLTVSYTNGETRQVYVPKDVRLDQESSVQICLPFSSVDATVPVPP
jgi:hypothetical protein